MARLRPSVRRGFTLVDAAGLIVACGAIGVTLLAMSCHSGTSGGGTGGAVTDSRAASRLLKCATQVRGITQAMIVWAAHNREQYPLPSSIDMTNDTVGELGRAKDTSANIMSMMINNGMFSPEICVCPDEHNKRICEFQTYEYTSPKSAKSPATALWDPAFGADFISGKGHLSYAHLQPSGDFQEFGDRDKDGRANVRANGRLSMWCNTFMSNEAVLGDRAPEIESVTFSNPEDPATARVKTRRSDSVTLKNHGDPGTWEGNIAYNDNHVTCETTLAPPVPPGMPHTYTDKSGAMRFDTFHFDEPDDPNQNNTFLGIFVKAGKQPSEFRGVWD